MSSSDLSNERLRERTLDDALCAALTASSTFRNIFLEAIGRGPWSEAAGGVFVRAVRSVYEARHDPRIRGETDVLAIWTSRSGERLDVHVEHKASAPFQKRQGERYAERAALSPDRQSTTVLIAPRRYLDVANVQARYFDSSVAAEQVLQWMREYASRECADHVRLLEELLARLEEGRALGAKGLFVDLYAAIHEELAHRGSDLRITNHPTDWLHLIDTNCVAGLKYVFRINKAVAEIAMTSAFHGDRESVAATGCPPLIRFDSGGSIFLRTRRLQVTPTFGKTPPTSEDVITIVDALELLSTELARIRRTVPDAWRSDG